MTKRLLLLILVMGFAMMACQVLNLADLILPGTVLLKDDFSGEDVGWQLTEGEQGIVYYEEDSFRILINKPHTQIWSNPGYSFTDVQVEADTLKIAGGDNNLFGLICRYRANEQFYAFMVSSDGYYGILKYQQGELKLLDEEAMLPTDLINPGASANHLRFDCAADSLVAYINGIQVAQVQDSSFTSGDVGLIAGAVEAEGVEIAFDDFSVLKP
jgi:hypothetical protein